MSIITFSNVEKSYAGRRLFANATFSLDGHDHAVLVGRNGSGKTTLLRLMSGAEHADSGTIARARGRRIWLHEQTPELERDRPVRDYLVEAFGDAVQLEAALRETEERLSGLAEHSPELRDAMRTYQQLQRRFEAAGGYSYRDRLTGVVEGLGLPDEMLERGLLSLSGGELTRVTLARALLADADLLLLDEPTNHLDIEGVLWLEEFVSRFSFPFLVVTHDRRFLERVTNRVIELNKRYPSGHFSSAGNYSAFLENREAFFDAQASREDSARNIVRGEIAWLRKGPRARATKQKARIDRAGELIEELSELEYHNAQGRAAGLDFNGSDRQTNRLIHAAGLEKSLGGRRLFGPLDLTLSPGDKLGLLGGNGSGKTTLLKILAGDAEPDAGTVRRADALRVAVFDQHRASLDLDMPLKRALCGNGEHVVYKGANVHVRAWASRFLFRQEQMDMPLRLLSGGEQARVLIAGFMLRPADVLLLDEPTNDLDLQSLEVLEESMLDFPGALVLVTHDRYLLERVSRRLLALDGRGEARFLADLSQWENWLAARRPEPAPAPEPSQPDGHTAKETRERRAAIRRLENELKTAEEQAARARLALEDPAIATDPGELAERHKKLEAALAKVEELFDRWSRLHD